MSLNIPSGQTVRLPVEFDIDVTSVANTEAHEPMATDRVAPLPTASAPVLTGIPGVSPSAPSVSPDVYNAGSGKIWSSLSWTTAGLPSSATLVVEVSTGNTPTPDKTWSPWTAVANGADIVTPGQYLQYRVRVLTANSSSTTTVPVNISLWVRMDSYVSLGMFTSSVFDAGSNVSWANVNWTANARPALRSRF